MTCLMNWPKGEAAQPVLHIGDATSCGRQKKIIERMDQMAKVSSILFCVGDSFTTKENLD